MEYIDDRKQVNKLTMILTSEDFPCAEPEVFFPQFVQKHMQHCAVYKQFFREHEVHCVRSYRKYLSVHTHLQVRVKQRSVPGDIDQFCVKQKMDYIHTYNST